MTTKENVNKIIDATFRVLQDVYENQREKGDARKGQPLSRIVFPLKRDGTLRVSEQELRFVFVEQLNNEIGQGWDVYYSVETPTQDTYNFQKEPRQDPCGQSAMFDLVIFDNQFHRIALIEFKANNPCEHDYKKDFVKLVNSEEGNDLDKFLIEIVVNADSGTIESLRAKIKGNESIFKCWSLGKGMEISINK